MHHHRIAVGLLAAALVLGVAACSGDDDSPDTAEPEATTSTTMALAEAAQAYTEPGPNPVGVATLELDGGVQVEVWYPAVEGTTGEVTYDVRELVPAALKALLTADVPATFTIDGARDADVADGEFPLVLYSHGTSGYRQASSFLTAHLASWGMVVAAPDHWSRDLFHAVGAVLGEPPVEGSDSVEDLAQTQQLIVTENTTAGSPFEGHIDETLSAVVGHSAGGGTAVEYAADAGIPYVSMASGLFRPGEEEAPALPEVPSLFVAGSLDNVASVDAVTRPAFEAAPAPTRLWVIEGAGHNAFDDVCTFGNGSGLIGVAVASGLGPFLDAQPSFRRLGEDGCIAPAVPVTDTFPIVQHVVTSFLRSEFGIDPVPVGLGPDVADQYVVPVAIEEKLQ